MESVTVNKNKNKNNMPISISNIKLCDGLFWIVYPHDKIYSMVSIHYDDNKVWFFGKEKYIHIMDLIQMEKVGTIQILKQQTIPNFNNS